jgi:hypothetical protein
MVVAITDDKLHEVKRDWVFGPDREANSSVKPDPSWTTAQVVEALAQHETLNVSPSLSFVLGKKSGLNEEPEDFPFSISTSDPLRFFPRSLSSTKSRETYSSG